MINIQWTFLISILLFVNKARSQCGSTQSVSASYASEVIASPGYNTGYSQNLVCTWTVSTTLSGASILFQIRDIWVSCSGDKVITYDGTDDTGSTIDDLCSSSGGGAKGNLRVPPSGNLFLKFTTNGVTDAANEKGFQFYYTAAKDFSGTGCSGSPQDLLATTTDSYISSPGFPDEYPLTRLCRWTITATDSSEHVYIEIIFLDVETGATCEFDSLRIEDGVSINSLLCETEWNYTTTYTSGATSFNLTFYSDDDQRARGFLLKYRQTQTVTTDTATTTPDIVTTTAPTTTGGGVETTDASTTGVSTSGTESATHTAVTTDTATTTTDIVTTTSPTTTGSAIETTDASTTGVSTSNTESTAHAATTLKTTAAETTLDTTAGPLIDTTVINTQGTTTDNKAGTSATTETTDSSTSDTTTSKTRVGTSQGESCGGTTCVLPAVLGSVIGTGVISVTGLFIVMKAKGVFGKYTPGNNKVNVGKGDTEHVPEKIDKNDNVHDKNNPEYITEKTAIDIVIEPPPDYG